MSDEPKMSLDKACYVLARAHTRDDDRSGFTVMFGGPDLYFFEFSQADYIEAWRILRIHVHLQTEPAT